MLFPCPRYHRIHNNSKRIYLITYKVHRRHITYKLLMNILLCRLTLQRHKLCIHKINSIHISIDGSNKNSSNNQLLLLSIKRHEYFSSQFSKYENCERRAFSGVFIKVYYTIVDGQRVFCLFITLLTPSTCLLSSFKGDWIKTTLRNLFPGSTVRAALFGEAIRFIIAMDV